MLQFGFCYRAHLNSDHVCSVLPILRADNACHHRRQWSVAELPPHCRWSPKSFCRWWALKLSMNSGAFRCRLKYMALRRVFHSLHLSLPHCLRKVNSSAQSLGPPLSFPYWVPPSLKAVRVHAIAVCAPSALCDIHMILWQPMSVFEVRKRHAGNN